MRRKTKRQSVTDRWRETYSLPRYQHLRSRHAVTGQDRLFMLLPHVDAANGTIRLRNAIRHLGEANA
jgi:hypothetical protein